MEAVKFTLRFLIKTTKKTMNSKRKSLKALTALGVGVAATPSAWKKPIVNSIVLPAHAQTSDTDIPAVTNGPPVGENFTVDALADTAVIIDLAPRVSDPDGDPITITIIGSGVLVGSAVVDSVSLTSPMQISASISSGNGSIFVDYQLNDGTDDSPVYRITIENLGAPLDT